MKVAWHRLDEICTLTKGNTGIMKAIPGPYPMVTLAEERRTHQEYQFDAKAVIIPLVSSTGHGHASLNRIHYQEGKFALGSILSAVIPKDESQLSARYLYYYLDLMKQMVLVPLMKGMANVSLPIYRIAEVNVPVPSLQEQDALVRFMEKSLAKQNGLVGELDAQKSIVGKLRQAILQEAIKGELTADWREEHPSVEPATKLLARIQAETDTQIKAKKVRKPKALPAIGADELPFDVPDTWSWSRLDGLRDTRYSLSYGVLVPGSHVDDGIPFVRVNDLDNAQEGFCPKKRISRDLDEQFRKTRLIGGDILLAVVGSVGKLAYAPASWAGFNIARAVSRFVAHHAVHAQYVYIALSSPHVQGYFQHAKSSLQPTLNIADIERCVIPLPPLAEQKAIVERIQAKFALCAQLEAEMAASERHAEHLSTAILQEVFDNHEPGDRE